jgi:hypothetical protein
MGGGVGKGDRLGQGARVGDPVAWRTATNLAGVDPFLVEAWRGRDRFRRHLRRGAIEHRSTPYALTPKASRNRQRSTSHARTPTTLYNRHRLTAHALTPKALYSIAPGSRRSRAPWVHDPRPSSVERNGSPYVGAAETEIGRDPSPSKLGARALAWALRSIWTFTPFRSTGKTHCCRSITFLREAAARRGFSRVWPKMATSGSSALPTPICEKNSRMTRFSSSSSFASGVRANFRRYSVSTGS